MSATDSFTAAQLRKNVLFQAMDARATNVRQTDLLYNPSPEVDSVIEHLVALELVRDEVRWRSEAMAEARLAFLHGDTAAAVAALDREAALEEPA